MTRAERKRLEALCRRWRKRIDWKNVLVAGCARTGMNGRVRAAEALVIGDCLRELTELLETL